MHILSLQITILMPKQFQIDFQIWGRSQTTFTRRGGNFYSVPVFEDRTNKARPSQPKACQRSLWTTAIHLFSQCEFWLIRSCNIMTQTKHVTRLVHGPLLQWFMACIKLEFCVKVASQMSHLKGFFLSWTDATWFF